MDSDGTHKTGKVRACFAGRPRDHVHFTPTFASWLNLVERFFGQIGEKWIKRNAHPSAADLSQYVVLTPTCTPYMLCLSVLDRE